MRFFDEKTNTGEKELLSRLYDYIIARNSLRVKHLFIVFCKIPILP